MKWFTHLRPSNCSASIFNIPCSIFIIPMSASPLSDNKFRMAFSLGWLVLMIMQAGVLHYWFEIAWVAAIADGVLSNLFLLLACLLLINTLRYYIPGREK